MVMSAEPLLWHVGRAEEHPSYTQPFVEEVFERYAPHFVQQELTVKSLEALGVKVTRATETMLKFTVDYGRLEFTD